MQAQFTKPQLALMFLALVFGAWGILGAPAAIGQMGYPQQWTNTPVGWTPTRTPTRTRTPNPIPTNTPVPGGQPYPTSTPIWWTNFVRLPELHK